MATMIQRTETSATETTRQARTLTDGERVVIRSYVKVVSNVGHDAAKTTFEYEHFGTRTATFLPGALISVVTNR